jgi:hypothetical protein
MRAIIICPFELTVREINIEPSLDAMYQALSPPAPLTHMRVSMVEAVGCMCPIEKASGGFDLPRLTAWIDEEGLLKPTEDQRYTSVPVIANSGGSNIPLAGRVLLAGAEDTADLDNSITVDSVESRTYFLGDVHNARRLTRHNPYFRYEPNPCLTMTS